MCGSGSKGLQAAHIIGRAAMWTRWRLRNGLGLCPSCHNDSKIKAWLIANHPARWRWVVRGNSIMDQEKENRTSVAEAIAVLSRQLVDDDFLEGPLQGLIYDHVDLPSEVMPFIKGVRLGAAYAISMILTGKLDLTLLEIETNQGPESVRQGDGPADSDKE